MSKKSTGSVPKFTNAKPENTAKKPIAKLQIRKMDVGSLTAEIDNLVAKAVEAGLKPTMARGSISLY